MQTGKNGRILALDGMRGTFALCVAYLHAFGAKTIPGGYLAVDFFFILSGFVVAYVYADRIAGRQIGFRDFAIARLARLYPLHIFTMLLALAADLAFADIIQGNWQSLYYLNHIAYSTFSNLLLIQNIGFDPRHAFNGVSWSISVELWVNLLLFALLLIRPAVAVSVIACFVCYAILFINVGNLRDFKDPAIYFLPAGLLRGIAGISLGFLVFRLTQLTISKKLRSGLSILTIASMAAMAWLVLGVGMGATDFLAPIFGSIMIIGAIFAPNNLVSRIFSIKPLVYLGTISYSVYLLHPILLTVLKIIAGGKRELSEFVWSNVTIYLISYTVIVIGVASVAYYFFERPMRQTTWAFFAKQGQQSLTTSRSC